MAFILNHLSNEKLRQPSIDPRSVEGRELIAGIHTGKLVNDGSTWMADSKVCDVIDTP